MSKFERPELKSVATPEESEKEFHFEEIADLEKALISLVEKLKENIDAGKYDTLISDDVGGRIPTLLLRKIMKLAYPDRALNTYFVASGLTYFPRPEKKEKYEKLQEYLRMIAEKAKHVLAVTQFIRTGKTMTKLVEALHRAGIADVDIAAIDNFASEAEGVYDGGRDLHKIHEEHEHLSGVEKSLNEYSPFPRSAIEVISKEGRAFSQKQWEKIFGIEKGDYGDVVIQKMQDPENREKFERLAHVPLSKEEKEHIQQNIDFAREDVNLLAEKVVARVWHTAK